MNPSVNPRTAKFVAIVYALLCHGAFAFAVAAMAWSLVNGMQVGWGRFHGGAAWAANALLLLQFPIGHSLLLTARGRRMIGRLAPAPLGVDLATTIYVAIASIQVALVFLLWSPTGVVWWAATGLVRWVLIAAFVSSWLLLAKSMFDAGLGVQMGYLGWTSVFKGRKPEYGPMPTRGLFAFSRQPIYVSFALTLVTTPVWTPDQLAIASVWIIYCLVGPLHKEAIFAARYGDAFGRYQRRVPYWQPRFTRSEAERGPVRRPEDIAIYAEHGPGWWTSDRYLVRALKALVKPRMKWFGRIAGPWEGQRVLDLGCGGGFMSEAIAREGAQVIGIDPALPAIEAAQDHAADWRLRISYEAGRAEAIPLADASVDRVVCVDVLEHVDDVPKCCREIARVLKPGGHLLFDTMNRTTLARWIMIGLYERVLRVAPHGTHVAHKFIRPEELRRHLEAAGLACGRFVGLGPIGINWRGDPVFSRWPILAMNYMGTATRTPSASARQPRRLKN